LLNNGVSTVGEERGGGFQTNPQNINKKGRPPVEESWAGTIRAAYALMETGTMTKKDTIAAVLVQKAMDGDLASIKVIMDRVDGLPVAKVENKNENTLKIVEEVVE